MASNIDTSIPRPGNADTRRLRQQFEVIKREIESLQAAVAEVDKALAEGLEPSDDAVMKAQLAAIAFSGSYYHLSHRPVIPQDAEDIGALPLSGGSMEGELLLQADARTGLNPVTLQQLNNRLAKLRNGLAVAARTGQYSDLLGLPVLGTAAATNAADYATAAQGAKADTATQPGELSLVATSGAYADLSGKPALGTAAATNATEYATAAQGAKADTATQPGELSLVATSGAYADLSGTPGNATTLVAGLMAAADKAKLNAIESGATADQTAAEILAALLTVHGADSGLDADKLDGKQLAALESEYRAYTDTAVSSLVGSSPETLDTLNELAAALGNDPDFATTVSNQIGTKLNASAYTAADVIAKLLTVHGAGSGLDADKLDGQHAAAFATAAQGAKADTATQPGDLSLVATSGAYADLSGKPALGTAAATNATAYATAAQGAKADTATQPGELSLVATSGAYADLSGAPSNATTLVAGLMAAADKAKLNAIESGATADQTAAEILAALLTVHGASSGLDADKLDGQHAAAFALVGHAHDYLPTGGKAADSDKLDGKHASEFASATQGGKADSATQPDDVNQARLARHGSYYSGSSAVNVDDASVGDFGLYSTGNLGSYPSGASFWLIATQRQYSGEAKVQYAISYNGNGSASTPLVAYRLQDNSGSIWTQWVTLWHSGNFNPESKLNASAYTAADVIAKLLTVHGPGSGLDADTLDGKHASEFATTAGVSSVLPPVNASPGAGSTINDYTAVDLDASAFATVGTADQHAAAQWQVSTTPDFSNIVYDSGEVTP